jgi:hypothetical protein
MILPEKQVELEIESVIKGIDPGPEPGKDGYMFMSY